MRSFRSIVTFVLPLVFASSVLADCAVLTPDDAEYYARWDAVNLLFKVVLVGVSCVLAAFGINNLLKYPYGWIAVAALAVVAIPIVLGFLIVEVMAMECGFGGIGAKYYLAPLAVIAFILFVSGRFPQARIRR